MENIKPYTIVVGLGNDVLIDAFNKAGLQIVKEDNIPSIATSSEGINTLTNIRPYIPMELKKLGTTKAHEAAIIVPVRTEPKIGRNELCPCGSGLKYKYCCINK